MMRILPQDALPHGPGMQLLSGEGESIDGWLAYDVDLCSTMSVLEADGSAPPELGLEMMAQACGMLIANNSGSEMGQRRIGVVGAVRGYSYIPAPFHVGERARVQVKADVCEDGIVVCDGELYRGDELSPSQRARITLIVTDEVAG
jgi:predicted hotdog family 3-hydroxylacyl-ACP dehydratase